MNAARPAARRDVQAGVEGKRGGRSQNAGDGGCGREAVVRPEECGGDENGGEDAVDHPSVAMVAVAEEVQRVGGAGWHGDCLQRIGAR